jgi:hypothetical protein
VDSGSNDGFEARLMPRSILSETAILQVPRGRRDGPASDGGRHARASER